MKRPYLFSSAGLFVILCIVFYACRKETAPTTEVSSANIDGIKSWFNATVLPVTLSENADHRESSGAGKMVLWDKVVTYPIGKDQIFEMPLASQVGKSYLLSPGMPGTNGRGKATGGTGRFAAARYVVVTQHKDGKKDYAIMSVIPDDAAGSRQENGHYKKMSGRFSGMVLYHTWEGQFMNGWVYEKGKIVKSILPAPEEERTGRAVSAAKYHRDYGPAVELAVSGRIAARNL